MDRKTWLTHLYREANLFLENHGSEEDFDEEQLNDFEPELHCQVVEILKTCDCMEDIIKFSLLKDPSPELWYGENNWQHVLSSVAASCLVHDVKGVIEKILSGELPRAPSTTIHQPPGD